MTVHQDLVRELQAQVALLEDDLRDRVEPRDGSTVLAQDGVLDAWHTEYAEARKQERTAVTWATWRDERVTQSAVAWVLSTVFIRFAEDNALVKPVWISGPEHRRQEALDAYREFFRAHPEATDREWLEEAIGYLASVPATKELVDERSAIHWVSPSGDAAAALIGFWRERGDDGALLRDFADAELSTRFLGDLYQDISAAAKKTYALLQTPEFVEEFILDRTLEPALAERPLEGFKIIDPTCGSGHFLLGAFARLLDRWHQQAPGIELQARVQKALDAIHGVDINPFAVAIARFRLILTALQACGYTRLEQAPDFKFHLATGDSLWFGATQESLEHSLLDNEDAAALGGFAYGFEDRQKLRGLLAPGRYDAVVGNPPYITVKDKALNAAYREAYSTCKGKYAMTVPFMELFFRLANSPTDVRPAGWVGQITSNSFMKREFGTKLIEQFLAKQDLRFVIDTSGAYIPGHGTPTVILVGRNQRPVSTTVRAVLGIRGEPGRPDDPAKGIVWRSIVDYIDDANHDDGWTSTADLDRKLLAQHPWSLTGGGAVQLTARLDDARKKLRDIATEIGISVVIGAEEGFETRPNSVDPTISLVFGNAVRDYGLAFEQRFWPYTDALAYRKELEELPSRWPFRTPLRNYLWFGKTRSQLGHGWLEYGTVAVSKVNIPLSIAFAFVATHNHFVLDRGGKVFKQSAPVIKLPEGATEDDHLALLGVLNSSTACFWLKQNSHDKGNGGIGGGIADQEWERFYEFTGTTLQSYPLPERLPLERGRKLDALATELSTFTPDAVAATEVPTRAALDEARRTLEQIRAQMIAQQEELDWEVYRLYGLVDEDFTYSGIDLPKHALGERAFEIALARKVVAGEEETAWFERHGSTPITEMPAHWPANYRDLVQRRLDLIASDKSIRLLEQPEHKRRWSLEPWEKQEERALRSWLLDRLEAKRFWFDAQGRPGPKSVAQLADPASHDADLVAVLQLWEGRPDVPVATSLAKLLADEAVPFLAAYRYKEPGLRKRADWESTWALQRREDAGETLPEPIPVPPKYTTADFQKSSYWSHRGKLDVPKERFILYPDAGRDIDPTPLLGWAGWDHAQQALALNGVIHDRVQDGSDEEQLTPLIAGLAELQPWVDQWHSGIDPDFGMDLADFLRTQLTAHATEVGKTLDQLASWRPATTTPRAKRKNG